MSDPSIQRGATAEDTIANRAVNNEPTDLDPHFVMDPQPLMEFSQPPRRCPCHWTVFVFVLVLVVGLILAGLFALSTNLRQSITN